MLPDKMFGVFFFCSLNIFNCELACSILLIGLIISSSIMFGWLGAYNINFHRVDRLRSQCFEWVFKVSGKGMVRQRESFLFFLSGTTCYFTFLGLVSFLILKSEARKTLQKILWDCIEYITSYLQGNILLTCIVLKMFFWFLKWTKYEWMEIFTNCFI